MSIGAGPQMSNFPFGFANGALIRGIPIQPTTPGKVFWLSNSSVLAPGGRGPSDGNAGSFESPFATLNGALAQCVAGRGDVIYVKPGHAETITSATSHLMNVDGVVLVGLGLGSQRPTFTYSTATAATFKVTGNGVSVVNCVFDCTGFASLAAGITVSAALDFSLVGCSLKLAGSTNQVITGLAASGGIGAMTLDSNVWLADAAAGTNVAIGFAGGVGVQIINNVIIGLFGAGVGGIGNTATASTDLLIKGNTIQNQTAVSTKAITCVAGSSGMISDNRMSILSGTAPITAAGMSWVGGNYYAASLAAAGTLI